jgi:hypothetical protein
MLAIASTVCALLTGPEIRSYVDVSVEAKRFLYHLESMSDMHDRLRYYQHLSGENRRRMVYVMASHLGTRARVRTTDLADDMVKYRVQIGEVKIRAQGLWIEQDLFIVGGRAAWAIAEITGLSVPELNEGLTPQEYQARVDKIKAKLKCYE